jgi:uncharacterized protein (TIGR02246 family)
MKRHDAVRCLPIVALGLGLVMAQDPKASRTPADAGASGPASQAADAGPGGHLAAIRAVADSFLEAYRAKDAAALGALFTEDAEIADDEGEVTRGRPAIVERFARLFDASQGGTLDVDIESTRLLSPDSAVEEGTATVSHGDGQPPESNHYSVIYVRQAGRWLHARIEDRSPTEMSSHDHLQDLAWMLGGWVNESDDATVTTTCAWSDDESFLVRQFDVKIEGRLALRGTQRIGWDPLRNQFHTWVFDNDGGFGEGLMSRDGDRWIIKSTGVRSDGQPVSATNIITVLGKDRIGWETSERTLADTVLPGSDRFVIVRKPPQPAG